jgi:outer membrane protein, heavy metal efflux system
MAGQIRSPFVLLLAAAVIGAGPAFAQAPPLPLQAALDEALARNPELILLHRQFDAARERPAQERFLAPPTFEAQIWQWPINTLNPARTNMYMFSLDQMIPGPGKRGLREALSRKDVELAEAGIAVRARDIVDRVKQAYADLLLARKAIGIQRASIDLLRQLADAAQAKYASGGISQQDVLTAVVEISTLHDGLITIEARAQQAEARLDTLLDRPPDAPIGALDEPRERALVPEAADLQQLAIEHHPDLAVSRIAAERARAQLAVVERTYKPDFSLMGGYMLMPGMGDAWMAQVGITWPTAPWSRGGADARQAEAVKDIEVADADTRVIENALRLAVQDAYIRVKAAERRASLLRTTVLPQSDQTLEVSRIGYASDRVDFLAIIDHERTRINAELEYFRALSDREQAMADLERAIGTDLPASMTVAADGQGEQ